MKIGKRNIPTWITATIGILLLVGVGVLIWAWPYVMSGSPNEGIVKIRRGSTLETVRDSLKSSVDEEFGETVYHLLTLTNSNLTDRHGAFKVKEGDSPYTVLRLLRSGDPAASRLRSATCELRRISPRAWAKNC